MNRQLSELRENMSDDSNFFPKINKILRWLQQGVAEALTNPFLDPTKTEKWNTTLHDLLIDTENQSRANVLRRVQALCDEMGNNLVATEAMCGPEPSDDAEPLRVFTFATEKDSPA